MLSRIENDIKSRKILKVIAGINNYNLKQFLDIIWAAQYGGATFVDIAANPEMVNIAKKYTKIPICISSTDPILIYDCVKEGVDLIEIGNYESFYSSNIAFSPQRILSIVEQIRNMCPSVFLCTTIPYHIGIHQQVELALSLERLGVNMLQTEGQNRYNLSTKNNPSIAKQIGKVSSTISSSHTLSKFVSTPIITSSGISHVSSQLAIQHGACGVGVGYQVCKMNHLEDQTSMVSLLRYSLELPANIQYKESSLFFTHGESTKYSQLNLKTAVYY